MKRLWIASVFVLILAACGNLENIDTGGDSGGNGSSGGGETGVVLRVIDGDTIDIDLNGVRTRVRYVGVNTPERDEACYQEATNANKALVEGKTVRLVKDVSNTDRYDRLLRFVYAGDIFVNGELVKQGFAEAALYDDPGHHDEFVADEHQAARAGRGCHPTGIFADGSDVR